MNWKAFNQLLKKYVEGKCTDREKEYIDQWYQLLRDEDSLVNNTELKNIDERLWNKIYNNTVQKDAGAVTEPVIRRLWIKLAAAVVFIGVVAIGILQSNRTDHVPAFASLQIPSTGIVTKENTSDKVLPIRMEDGSTITLDPGASVHYPFHFEADKREVYLEGNAFFNVSKNAARPFYVYSNNLVTQVLGTSFHVRTDKNSRLVEVAVTTGKVAVYENEKDQPDLKNDHSNSRKGGALLTPNQKVIYYAKERHFVTSLVEKPVPLIVEKGKTSAPLSFVFEDEPLSSVLSNLEKTYGIEIVTEKENLNNIPFTGDITEQDIFGKLEFICTSIGAGYEIKGTTIMIKGRGKGM
jgi:ferric-dicitrate binding protein FerR (iron transport regulator)